MKNLILVKSHPCVQVAHLYEHLFLREVNDIFFDSKLYKNLDYNAHGTTYNDSGIVLFDCDLFSEEAQKLHDFILKIRIDFGEDYDKLYNALWQMSAELPYKLELDSVEKLIEELKVLDEQEWKHLDDIDWMNTKNIRRKTFPLYITHTESKTIKISVSLTIDKTLSNESPELLPLYYIVARMMLYNLNTRLARDFGVYEAENISISPKTQKATSLLWSFPRHSDVKVHQADLNQLMNTSKEMVSKMYTEETILRLANDLSDTSYSQNILYAPNYDQILDTTYVLMGSEGWKKIATVEIIKKVISNIDLEFKAGRLKVTERVKL